MATTQIYSHINQDCFKLDLNIRQILDEITQRNKNGDLSSSYLQNLYNLKTLNRLAFDGKNCENVIELKKLNESANLITKKSIEQEKSILSKSNKNQYIYIIGGGIILIVGLFILIKK